MPHYGGSFLFDYLLISYKPLFLSPSLEVNLDGSSLVFFVLFITQIIALEVISWSNPQTPLLHALSSGHSQRILISFKIFRWFWTH